MNNILNTYRQDITFKKRVKNPKPFFYKLSTVKKYIINFNSKKLMEIFNVVTLFIKQSSVFTF